MKMRSIYFRLIVWYTGLVICLCVSFGAYTYKGLEHYLTKSLQETLHRRAVQIGDGIVADIENAGSSYLAKEIERIFTPEANNRFVRITDKTGTIVYLSGMPKDAGFNPKEISALSNAEPVSQYVHKLNSGKSLLVSVLPFQTKQGDDFLIEVGGDTESIHNTLYGLLLTLGIGLPIIILLAACGGYLLVKNSLRPVDEIRKAAKEITLSNLSKRLPVSATGDSIEELSHTLNHMINRLDESYQQVSKFSADASHELRTPLSIMRVGLETLIMLPELPEIAKERLGSILEEALSLTKITEGLFAISRLDAGEARMQNIVFNISNLVAATSEQIEILTDEKNIKLDCIVNDDIYVEGDPSRMKQVLINLLDNAIKYTQKNGSISLKLYAENNKAILEISDTGIGIGAEDLPHIFKRFYRADKVRSHEPGSGAGIGLAIVRSICTAHNGDIQVESEEHKGTKFKVMLPLAEKNKDMARAA